VKIGFITFTDLSKQRADAIHTKNLLREFEKLQIDVTLLKSRLENVQFRLKQLNFVKKTLGRLIFLLRMLVVKNKYDLFYIRDWLFAYLMSFFGFRYVFEVNGLISYEGLIRNYFESGSKTHRIFRCIEKGVLTSAKKVVCVSEGMRKYCVTLGTKPDKILVAENAANTEVFNPDVQKVQIQGGNDRMLIGWMGSFESHHGFEDLVSIAGQLKNRNCRNVKFLIIGGGRHEDELKQNLAEENLQDYFIFCGGVLWNEVPGYMLNADFCLSLDKRSNENLEYRNVIGVTQVKVYEYLALGKAVLAQDLGNAREFFEKRKIGWVCGTEPEQVAKKIIEITKKPRQIGEYGKNALTASREKHSWKITATKIVDFLKEPV
jgi:starch synthase